MTEYYYQIDYIDEKGLANYIDTFHNRYVALEHLAILNNANRALNGNKTKFVLDKYCYKVDNLGRVIEDTDELIEKDITINHH